MSQSPSPYGFLKGLMINMDDIPADPLVVEETPIEPIDTHPDETPDITHRVDGVTIGTESISSFYQSFQMEKQDPLTIEQNALNTPSKMGMFNTVKPMNHIPQIRTTDQVNFRVFLKAQHEFTDEYITRLCRFLDSRTPNQTITFYLGNSLSSRYTMIIGSVLSSIMSCPAKTIAIAAGCCGVPESMMWCFCQERHIAEYSALTFGGTNLITHYSFYKYYLEVCFERAVEVGILSKEQVDTIWNENKEIMITYVEQQ